MPLPSGLSGQIGYKAESTYGTGVTVDRFLPLISESIKPQIQRLESAGIIAGREILDSEQWAAGNKTYAGQVQHELYDHGIGLLFTWLLGAVSTTGAGPYTHTFTPGDLSDDFFTMQIGRPDIGGTVRPYTYTGCMATGFEIALKQGEIATLGMDVVAQAETTGTALASASYASDLLPVTFAHGAVTIGGSAVNVMELTLAGDNGLNVDRRFIGATTIAQPKRKTKRAYTGSLMMEFEDLTEYGYFTAGTEIDIVCTLTVGSNTITITMHARVDDPDGPNVSGEENLGITLPYKLIGDGSDADALEIELVNSDATP